MCLWLINIICIVIYFNIFVLYVYLPLIPFVNPCYSKVYVDECIVYKLDECIEHALELPGLCKYFDTFMSPQHAQ